eukprot:9241228-Pyramimonas_sp.AAC.1
MIFLRVLPSATASRFVSSSICVNCACPSQGIRALRWRRDEAAGGCGRRGLEGNCYVWTPRKHARGEARGLTFSGCPEAGQSQ